MLFFVFVCTPPILLVEAFGELFSTSCSSRQIAFCEQNCELEKRNDEMIFLLEGLGGNSQSKNRSQILEQRS